MKDLWIDSKNFKNYTVTTADGEIGKIKDFYFEDTDGYIRYLVVNTEHFMFRNLVLVSPIAISNIDTEAGILQLSITKQQLEKSPAHTSVDTLTRLYEKAYNEYFAWPNYWDSIHGPWVMGPFGAGYRNYEAQLPQNDHKGKSEDTLKKMDQCHLRELGELLNYGIESSKGERFGSFDGAIINLRSFRIEYWVIDTINFLPSKHVLYPYSFVEEYRWKDRTARTMSSKGHIKNAPSYQRPQNGVIPVDELRFIDRFFQQDKAA